MASRDPALGRAPAAGGTLGRESAGPGGGTLAEAANAVGSAIGVPLQLHDSSLYGGDYYVARRDLEELILLENYLEDDDESFFQTQPVGAICVQISGFAQARERLAAVPGLRRA